MLFQAIFNIVIAGFFGNVNLPIFMPPARITGISSDYFMNIRGFSEPIAASTRPATSIFTSSC